MGVHVRRGGGFAANWKAMQQRIAPRIQRGILAASNVLLVAAQEGVPKDTMALHDSGMVRKKEGGLGSVFIVGFGREDFPVPVARYGKDRNEWPPHEYAVYVHEVQVSFLSNAIETAWADMVAALLTGANVGA